MTGPGADQASEHANAQSSIMTVGGGSQQGGCGAWRLPFDLVRGWMPGAPGWSGKDQDSSGHDSSNGSSSVSPSSTSQSSYAGGLGKASQAPAKWGCFSTIQTEFSDTLEGRILSFGVGLRTRVMGLPYGDQAMFVERRTLEEVRAGGRLLRVRLHMCVPACAHGVSRLQALEWLVLGWDGAGSFSTPPGAAVQPSWLCTATAHAYLLLHACIVPPPFDRSSMASGSGRC